MSIYNRPFNRGGMGGFTFFPPVIKALLISNVALYLLDMLLGTMTIGGLSLRYLLIKYFALWPIGTAPAPDYPMFLPWQLFSYMFLHSGFFHIVMNMLVL